MVVDCHLKCVNIIYWRHVFVLGSNVSKLSSYTKMLFFIVPIETMKWTDVWLLNFCIDWIVLSFLSSEHYCCSISLLFYKPDSDSQPLTSDDGEWQHSFQVKSNPTTRGLNSKCSNKIFDFLIDDVTRWPLSDSLFS